MQTQQTTNTTQRRSAQRGHGREKKILGGFANRDGFSGGCGGVRTPPEYLLTPPEWFCTPPKIFSTPPPKDTINGQNFSNSYIFQII